VRVTEAVRVNVIIVIAVARQSAVLVFMRAGRLARRGLAVYAHIEIHARYPVHPGLARNQFKARNTQLVKLSAKSVRIRAQMYKRAERHIAADARHAIKIKYAFHKSPLSFP
jgi:hypothetical protein